MTRLARTLGALTFALLTSTAYNALAVAPNPLENAYWRFEEGTPGNVVNPPNAEAVLDSSGNANHMRAYKDTNPSNPNPNASPTYTSFVPTKQLKSGAANSLAFDFNPFPNGKDIYSDARNINNGIIAPGGGFTVEAAFYPTNPATWGTIIAKEGQAMRGGPDADLGNLPTLSLMTNADNSHLLFHEFDAAGNYVEVQSLAPLAANQWYYTAVVNNGSTVSLYLDSGAGYELQASAPVAGALYQGPDFNNNATVDAADYISWRKNHGDDPARYTKWRAAFGKGPDWEYNWSIGRGVFGGIPSGSPANWFSGTIDEVRLSNTALAPADFLFAPQAVGSTTNTIPEPTTIALAALAIFSATLPRRRR
jgi:hypothetical protein